MTIWAIVPAAGVGARMNATTPKQYLLLNDRTVLEHTLGRLSDLADLRAIVVALSPQDTWWSSLTVAANAEILTCQGAESRCQSVLNALVFLHNQDLPNRAQENDWVLVHDAVRPCVMVDDIERLLSEVSTHPAGGILGIPASSTLKRVAADDTNTIVATLERTNVWQACTPQVFRFGLLRRALEDAISCGALVTDEASAVERAGYAPKIVRCRADNIKITYPEDLPLAALIICAQEGKEPLSREQERSDVE